MITAPATAQDEVKRGATWCSRAQIEGSRPAVRRYQTTITILASLIQDEHRIQSQTRLPSSLFKYSTMVSRRLILLSALFATTSCLSSAASTPAASVRGGGASNQKRRDNIKQLQSNLKKMHKEIEAYIAGEVEEDEQRLQSLQHRVMLYQSLLDDHHLLDEEKSDILLEKMQRNPFN